MRSSHVEMVEFVIFLQVKDVPNAPELMATDGVIEFANVGFYYQPRLVRSCLCLDCKWIVRDDCIQCVSMCVGL